MTNAMVRCASTWSGPFCASSSTTKIAVCGQNFDWLTASTNRPNARSFSATYTVGVGFPGVVPAVWSFGRPTSGIRAHRPLVAVGADLPFDIKIVQQHKLARDLVMIGRHLFGK